MTQPLPFPLGSVERAISQELGEGPVADALRDLAKAAAAAPPPPPGGGGLGTLFFGTAVFDGHTGTAPQLLYPGYGLYSLADGAEGPEIRVAKAGSLSSFYARHVGDPANTGMTIDYEFVVNGVVKATLPNLKAYSVDSLLANFSPVPVVPGDSIRIRGVPAIALAAVLTNVVASLG